MAETWQPFSGVQLCRELLCQAKFRLAKPKILGSTVTCPSDLVIFVESEMLGRGMTLGGLAGSPGVYEQYGFTHVTHVIADNLASGNQTWAQLKRRTKRVNVVTSSWVMDCVKESRRDLALR